jgi:hypothetical protein
VVSPKERETREWWVINDGTVVRALGYSCAPDHPECWWFPQFGSSMTEGYHVFSERGNAVQRALADLLTTQRIVNAKIKALEQS